MNCQKCEAELKATQNEYFLKIGIENQIKKIVQNNITDILSFSSRVNDESCISDITDGDIFRKINLNQLNRSEIINLSVTMNTVQVYSNQTHGPFGQFIWLLTFFRRDCATLSQIF